MTIFDVVAFKMVPGPAHRSIYGDSDMRNCYGYYW